MLKTIMVTGGAGYIGSFTTRQLLDDGYEVVVVDNLENGHRQAVDKRAKLEVVDVGNADRLDQVFKKYPIEAVVDFAAYLAVGESMEKPKKYLKNNVENFVILLDTMQKNGCRYVIKSSTASTYGNPEDKYFPLKEDYQNIYKPEKSALLPGKWQNKDIEGEEFLQKIIQDYHHVFAGRPALKLTGDEIKVLRIPASVYGLTKLMDEILIKKYDKLYAIKSVALRYFNVCGAAIDGSKGDDKPVPTNLMTLCFMNVVGKIAELKVFGTDYPTKDGTGIRDYIHPLDLATGHVAALRYLKKTNESNVINLGTGRGDSVFDVIKAVESASGKKVKYTTVARRSGDPAISYSDPSKAEKILGWKAQYSLGDMAGSAWKWHKSHPNGYND